MNDFDLHAVVTKLNGPISPVADSRIDEKRYSNLVELVELVEQLIGDIEQVAAHHGRAEASLRKAGWFAKDWIAKWVKQP